MSNPMPRTPRTAICLAGAQALPDRYGLPTSPHRRRRLSSNFKTHRGADSQARSLRKSMQVEEAKLAEIRRAVEVERLEATRGAGPAGRRRPSRRCRWPRSPRSPWGSVRPRQSARMRHQWRRSSTSRGSHTTWQGYPRALLQYSYASTNRVAGRLHNHPGDHQA